MTTEKGEAQSVTISGIQEEVPGVKTFHMTFPEGRTPVYKAGQFITLAFTHHGKEERRSFSLSSTPGFDEQLSFTVKRIDNGAYSRLLADRSKPGDQLRILGPSGFFTLPPDIASYQQVFFFAAGIGITPILPLIKTLLYQFRDISIVLVYSNRNQAETVFFEVLTRLASQYMQQLKVVYLFSNAYDLSRARLNKMLVKALLEENRCTTTDKMLFFTCGPYAYMRMVIYALEEYGANRKQIRKEHFDSIEKPAMLPEPPDREPHVVRIVTATGKYNITVHYPQTILQAAKQEGLSLPYSCEAGRCGSCAAICTSGQVWHSYNEVLTDTELRHGSILTCTGYPVGGDAEILI
jgi:ring-1,2-phenylacetyl-CoA epoxidase subunit PaaE